MESTGRNSALGSAIVVAVASSLCCILPVLTIAFGISALGVASFFETLRPFLLIVSFVALGIAFYQTYFRKEACAEGEACATKPIGRINQLILWTGTLAVMAFALFPFYTGYLVSALGSNAPGDPVESRATPANNSQIKTELIIVDGMTCEGCAAHIDKSIKKLKGVALAEASYKNGNVKVTYDPKQIRKESIKEAIRELGYKPE